MQSLIFASHHFRISILATGKRMFDIAKHGYSLRKLTRIRVCGVPAPQGSKAVIPVYNRHRQCYMHDENGRPLFGLVESNASKLRLWRQEITRAAANVYGQDPVSGPVVASAWFWFSRPKKHWGTGRNETVLKSTAPAFMTRTPDISKLIRAVEDALTGIIWEDDAQIVGYNSGPFKMWCDRRGDEPNMIYEVWELVRDDIDVLPFGSS